MTMTNSEENYILMFKKSPFLQPTALQSRFDGKPGKASPIFYSGSVFFPLSQECCLPYGQECLWLWWDTFNLLQLVVVELSPIKGQWRGSLLTADSKEGKVGVELGIDHIWTSYTQAAPLPCPSTWELGQKGAAEYVEYLMGLTLALPWLFQVKKISMHIPECSTGKAHSCTGALWEQRVISNSDLKVGNFSSAAP